MRFNLFALFIIWFDLATLMHRGCIRLPNERDMNTHIFVIFAYWVGTWATKTMYEGYFVVVFKVCFWFNIVLCQNEAKQAEAAAAPKTTITKRILAKIQQK